MKSRNYYTLVTSLPHLPRFDKADHLPISRERLLERLKMLEPEDHHLAEIVAEFIAWRRNPIGRTNEEIISIYNKGVEHIFESPLLKPLLELSINQRTILTALRRKEAGLPRPDPKEKWGAGTFVKQIEHNWDHPFFKLQSVCPWIMQAQIYLKQGQYLNLDFFLMNLIWNKLDQLLFKTYFGFEAVISYLVKWDILQQRLSYKMEEAKVRFEKLVLEAINGYS